MHVRRGIAGLVVTMLAVPLAGPGRTQSPTCTWSIGMMGALDGHLATRYGRPIADGIRLAVELANRERDLACVLTVHAEDTQGSPSKAPPKAEELVADEQVVACVCAFFSGEALATGEIFDEAGLLMASTGTNRKMDEQGFGTWFRAIAADPKQGAATARYVVDGLGARSVVVVHDGQDYSEGIARDVANGVGDRLDGGQLIINPEEVDYSAVVAQIEKRDPDVVYYGGYSPQAGPLLRQLRQAGVRSLFVTGDGGMDGLDDYLKGLRGRIRARAACPCSDPTEIEAAATFVAEFETYYGHRPKMYAADAFDVTNVAIDALRELSGTESTDEVRAHVVAHFDAADGVEGTVKDYTWNERGELVGSAKRIFIWKWRDEPARFEYVGRVSELVDR